MDRNRLYDICSRYLDVDVLTKGFVEPIINPVREKASLMNHAARNVFVDEHPLCEEAARILSSQCSRAKVDLPVDWKSDHYIGLAIDEVDRSSSPGFPFLAWCPNMTNGDVIDSYGAEWLTMMVRKSLDGTLQNDIRIFLKCEPHKREKVEKDMQRIISSVGLIEQIADRVLYRFIKMNLDEAYPYIPVATGWSDKKGRFIQMLKMFPQLEEVIDTDKSTWDWTVTLLTLTMLKYFLTFMHSCRDQNSLEDWNACMRNRMKAMYGPGTVLHCSDGSLFEQTWWGIWKSGGFLTLHGNAIMNACVDILAKLRLGYTEEEIKAEVVRSFGDDVIQTKPRKVELEVYLNELASCGVIVKPDEDMLGVGVSGRKFCGHKIVETEVCGRRTFGLVPERLGKHLINLVTAPEETAFDTLSSMKLNWVTDFKLWDTLNRIQYEYTDLLPDGIKWRKRIKSRAQDLFVAYGSLFSE